VGKSEWTSVLFDFGGTLDADGIPWKERFFRLCRDEGLGVSPAEFDRVFYAADDALVGTIPPTLSFRDTVARLARGVTGRFASGDRMLGERIAKRFLDGALERLSASVKLLGQLSHRYRLGIVSNFYGNLATVCDEVGLGPLLTVVVDSARVGCLKPAPQIFLHALAGLGAEPAEAVFVGDSLVRDMAGARGVGMAHIWLTPGESSGTEACCPNDPVVHTLDGVRELLLWPKNRS
jgi:putative hydrolase of the HAD superfamily